MPSIASQDVKFEKDTEVYKLTKLAIAEDLDEETATKLTEIAIKSYPRGVRSFLRCAGRQVPSLRLEGRYDCREDESHRTLRLVGRRTC
jgi:hypothetical protein